MFKILVLLASSVLFFNTLNAKDFPLERKLNIKIQNRTTTVLEFPFIIKDKTFEHFKQIKKVKKSSNQIEVPKIKRTVKIIDGKKVIVKKPIKSKSQSSSKPITISVSKNGNVVHLKPKTLGTTKIILWGYEKYPVMVNIEVTDEVDKVTDYYYFIDYTEPKNEVVKFESLRHEYIIEKLMRHGYLNTTPNGYTKTIAKDIEETNDYKMTLNSITTGNKYGIKVYDFLNKTNDVIILKNKMFYKKGAVYSVSIEKLSKKLKPNEKTRVFVVFKNKS